MPHELGGDLVDAGSLTDSSELHGRTFLDAKVESTWLRGYTQVEVEEKPEQDHSVFAVHTFPYGCKRIFERASTTFAVSVRSRRRPNV